MEKKWKDIPGYEGLYQASTFGIIKSYPRNTTRGRILKPNKIKNRYLQVCLLKNGVRKGCRVHRLILQTFIGPCPLGMECRHLDGDPRNNRLDNLEWSTHKENIGDKVEHGTLVNNLVGSKHWKSKLTESDIPKIRKLIKEGLSNIEIGKIFSVGRRCIADIRNNKTWRHVK
jgi:hypothetical protein